MDRCTPALAVIDSSGMAVRSVAYCRQSETDAPQARITQNIYERQTRTCHSRDPRLVRRSGAANVMAGPTQAPNPPCTTLAGN
jgi:hypothetical protein